MWTPTRTSVDRVLRHGLRPRVSLALARSEEQRVIRLVHLGGPSVREVARALGLSHQRVQQIIDAAKDGRDGSASTSRVWR